MRALAWDALARGVTDRHHPARHMVLATTGPQGPEARTVVLRGWTEGVVECHTDRASAKVRELDADPRAALLVWVPTQNLQVRLAARIDVLNGDTERWARVPKPARAVYGGTPPPGATLADPDAFQPQPSLERFTVLLAHVMRAEVLHLGQDLHRRAVFHRDGPGWAGTWIAP